VKKRILSDCDKKPERGSKEKKCLIRGEEKLFLHHDKAPAHSSLLIREFSFTKHEMTLIPQPPYSPDLAPSDFFIFTKLKSVPKG
jgi:transposase